MLTFTGPLVKSSGLGAQSSAAAGQQAFSIYPDGVVLSLWDRLHANLSGLEHDQMLRLSTLSSHSEKISDQVSEMENKLIQEESDARAAEASVEQGMRDVGTAMQRLEAARKETAAQKVAMSVQIRSAEAKVDLIKRKVQRFEVTHEILELGKLMPEEDVTLHLEDSGAVVSFIDTGTGGTAGGGIDTLLRRAGSWCGTPVTIDEIRLPKFPVEVEDKDMHRKFAKVTAPPRQCWEVAVQRELRLAGKLRHPNLVEYYGGTIAGDTLRLVSEPPLVPLLVELKGGKNNQLDFGRSKGRLSVAHEVALALEYLHCRGVVHRRVTLGCIYLRDAPRLIAKLGDLLPARVFTRAVRECAVAAHARQANVKGRRNGQTAASGALVDSVSGGPSEQLQAQEDKKATDSAIAAAKMQQPDPRNGDILALGVIVLQLFSADSPGEADILASTVQALNSAAVARIHDRGLRLVVMRCMEKDPNNRISATGAARALEGAMRGDAFLGLEATMGDISKTAPLVDADLEAFEFAEKLRDIELADKRIVASEGDSMYNSTLMNSSFA